MSLESLPLDCLLIVLSSVATKDILALACANRSFSQQLKDDCVWRALAERKWGGTRVPELTARVRPGGWKAFCQHRISLASLPPSPLNLVQELYPDPWQHLAACLLCSRTTGGSAVRGAIAALLAALPTPSAVLDASKEALWELLHPLGLQAARCSALRNMSRDFLERDWEEPSEFKGCGKFVTDSWRIFCRGHCSLKDVEDKSLLAYLRWLTKGELEERGRGRAKKAGGRKRKREEPAAPPGEGHWLRSRKGRTPDVPDRRVTRSAASGGQGPGR